MGKQHVKGLWNKEEGENALVSVLEVQLHLAAPGSFF